MVDIGLQGFPPAPEGMDRLTHIGRILERVPPEVTTVWIDDHLQFGAKERFEGWTLLTYLAAAYPRFRYGHLVLSQSFRNPALLAKMAATLQALTGGRFILGIGAGWHEEEYRAYGYDYPSGGVRVEQLAEAIEVMRAMWTQSPASYEGRHYRVQDAYCEPRPEPPIPIMVGTNGPRALRVTARLADWWNWDGPWEPNFREPYEVLAAHCADIGRPVHDIVLTACVDISIPDDPAQFEASYEHRFYPGKPFHVLGPTPDDVVRELDRLIEHGVVHFQATFEDMRTFDRFIGEVIPAMRPRLSATN